MALGKYSRVDGRKSTSSYCSTATFVALVSLFVVGVWMMTSSSVVPVQHGDVARQDNRKDMKEHVSQTQISEENTRNPNEDNNSGDSSDDTTNVDPISNSAQDENPNEEVTKPDDSPKTETVNDSPKRDDSPKTETVNDSPKRDDSPKTETVNDSPKPDEDLPKEKPVSEENLGKSKDKEKTNGEVEIEKEKEGKGNGVATADSFPSGAQSEILNENTTQNGAWATQAAQSKNTKEAIQSLKANQQESFKWKLCNVTAGPDYIPCLDNLQAIKSLPSTMHYEHLERHCPSDPPTCLVSLPKGYQQPILWPASRDKIWLHNVPHTKLVDYKGHQNWVKVSGEHLIFPGGGTQFIHGVTHYIEKIQESVPEIAWGERSRVVLDVGCGVASFGGYLFDKNVLTMSLAPKDEHQAQIQFALERGIPAVSNVMATTRLPYPGRVFDVLHCARCRVPWHIEGGKLLLELNRVLRPGGYFVWSATPVYRKGPEDAKIWEDMKQLTKAMCWELVNITTDKLNQVGIATYRKPTSNDCYEKRPENQPPICQESDDPNAAWNVPLQACMHRIPTEASVRGSQWPEKWPARLGSPPYWLLSSQVGVYGKPAPEDFSADYEHWKRVVSKSYLNGLGISWSNVRNVMDMKAVYGGFAAALKELNNVWVMNVVPIDSPDTLPIIYERGLFGIYHDWCQSFNTYPRSYDLLHADHIFSKVKKRCNLVAVVAETDRILRPGGKLIVRDGVETINALETLLKSLQWEIRLTYSKDKEGLLCAQKTMWRPKEVETIKYAIAA